MNYIHTFILCLLMTVTMQAQKFGHINSQQLLLDMPEIKEADGQLQSFQEGLIKKGEGMIKVFEANYNKYTVEVQEGNLSKLQMQQREGDLAKEQQAIQQFELEVQQKLLGKRQELYQPILDRVKVVVEQVGKDGGYTMIFDSSIGTLLHAATSDDLMSTVKSKLGM